MTVTETEPKKYILDGHKLLWHRDRVEAWLRGERIAPITMDCALTRACNYRCIYCYGRLQENVHKPMTKDVIYRFLDDASEIGVKAISFVSDGESTSSPHFYDAVSRGKANGLDMAVGTHGVLLKPERLPGLLKALTYLRFNVSAADPKRYAHIHGCKPEDLDIAMKIIQRCVEIKRKSRFDVTLGLQMVLMPEFADQIIPMAKLGQALGVDYLVIKHCSDDEFGSLGVDYAGYRELEGLLKEAERYSTQDYLVQIKWSKIKSEGNRRYIQCYGPPFIMQLSGSGLVAPCGMLFNDKYKKFHIGNIADTPFKELWKNERYWEVIALIASAKFDARKDCGCLCLQDRVNEFLWDVKNGNAELASPAGPRPAHINFV